MTLIRQNERIVVQTDGSGNATVTFPPVRLGFAQRVAVHAPALPTTATNTATVGDWTMPLFYGGSCLSNVYVKESEQLVIQLTGATPGTSYEYFYIAVQGPKDEIEPTLPSVSPSVAAINRKVSNVGYASLTGPGQTTTPGMLTQAGGLFQNSTQPAPADTSWWVDFSATDTNSNNFGLLLGNGVTQITASSLINVAQITLHTNGSLNVEAPQVNISSAASGAGAQVAIGNDSAGSIIQLNARSVFVGANANDSAIVGGSGGTLGFYGQAGIARQSSAGITTVAQVVTALKNLGLLS